MMPFFQTYPCVTVPTTPAWKRKSWIVALAFLAAIAIAPVSWGQPYVYQLNDGFESGSLGAPWVIEWAAYDTANVTVQTSPVRAGNYAVHLVNNYTDPAGSNERTEMTAGAGGTLHWGQEYWIGFSFYLKDWAASSAGEMVHQFHAVPNGGNWNNVAARDLTGIAIVNNMMTFNTIVFPKTGPAAGGALGDQVWSAPVRSNTWYDWVVHVIPSTGTDGLTEIWLNGTRIYQQSGPNVDLEDSSGAPADPTHYLKCGVYNSPWKTASYPVNRREIVYDQVKVGCVGSGYTGGYAGVAPQGTVAVASPESEPASLDALWTSSSQVKLSWANMASDATGVAIERRTGLGGAYVQIGTVAAGVTTYTDTGLAPNTTYCYRVRAYNTAGSSDYSLEATARREDFSAGAADFAVQQGTWSTAAGQYQVTANGAGPVNAALSLLNTPVAGNFILTADCSSVNNPGSWDNFNLIFGYQDANNFYYVNAAESANGYWNGLYKVVGGVTTRLTTWTAPFTPGTVYTMKVQRVGQSILVYRAGALVASVPDATFPAGKVGFGTSQPTSGAKLAQFSNVTLTQNDLLAVEQDFSGGAGDFTVAQGTWAVNAGSYQVTSLGGNIRAASLALLPPLGADDFTVMADGVIVNSPSSWDNLNIVFNYQDINNYYCVNIAESDNTDWNGIFKVQGGVATAIANWTTTFTPGITYTMKVVKNGSSITVYSNNVLLGTATDATFSGGQIGFGTSQTTTGSKTAIFDNIIVFPPSDYF